MTKKTLCTGGYLDSSEQAPVSLTSRQQQILALMQQGKVNKEIARELDITLGTVKQHLVAIFKKLNVQNRTMAVARLAEFKDQSGFSEVFAQETLIAMRPAIVLSLKMNGRLPRAAHKCFHNTLSELAFDCNALFISREPGDGDLIFGLRRSSAQDMRTATEVAHSTYQIISRFVQEHYRLEQDSSILTGALVAGLITVSQDRFGGWSGETIGSHILSWGHDLRNSTQPGYLFFDEPVKAVMQAFDLTAEGGVPSQIAFADINTLSDWDVQDTLPLVGRSRELQAIQHLLQDHFRLLILEGENGMGKSRLCREAARLALAQNETLFYIRVLPTGFLDSAHHRYFDRWQDVFAEGRSAVRSFVVIEDVHHLDPVDKTELTQFLNALPEGVRVLVCGRQPLSFDLSDELRTFSRQLHLDRLDDSDIDRLLTQAAAHPDFSANKQSISERSRGVPLFVKELLLQKKAEIPLALLITVAARIDKFRVDWKLLYCVASHSSEVSLSRLSRLMRDDMAYIEAAVQRAESLGILECQDARVRFRHPLVQDVVHYLFKPNNPVDTVSDLP